MPVFSSGSKAKSSISYSELNTKYSISGPLGMPLGQGLSLEVKKITLNTKEAEKTLEILAVNGKKLKKPFLLSYRMFIINDSFIEGNIYQVKAYQDGAFHGIPADALKENMVQTTDYYFKVFLVIYKIL